MSRPTIVLCSQELIPFGGGGIGTYVALAARALAPVADVTVLTASWHKAAYRERSARGDPRVAYGGAAVEFVEMPPRDARHDFYTPFHLYSHRILERLRELFGATGPDLVEFADYLGEGFVTTQACRSADAFLAETVVAVRLHTSAEMAHVLNGHLPSDLSSRIGRDLERRTLRDADVIVQSGGDILGTYERFYGDGLAPAVQIRYPMEWPDGPSVAPALSAGPLRMLYVGRCERRKGVQDLIAALTSLSADWRLTVLGGDTPTAPLGRSMRRTLELQAGDDPRIAFASAVGREALPALMAQHDVVVVPSRWECWPYVALEALAAGKPVVGTAVGGLKEMVKQEVTGWRARGAGTEALIEVLAPLVAEPARAREPRDPRAVTEHLRALADEELFRAAYLELSGGARVRRARGASAPITGGAPLVSVVIPYFRMHRFVEESIVSVRDQTYARIELLVVDDGSFAPKDVVLAEMATRYPLRVVSQPNRGLGGARNFGITQSRGRYVLPLDADNVLEPTFVARCVALLEADEELVYVTSWNRYVDEAGVPFPPPNEGYRPVGNWTPVVEELNVAGDGTAVLRRSVFDRHRFSEDLTSYEDWALYRELHRAGRHGHVIPEMLFRYRVREDSMLREVGLRHEERLRGEIEAVIREQEVAWAPTKA